MLSDIVVFPPAITCYFDPNPELHIIPAEYVEDVEDVGPKMFCVCWDTA